MAKIQTYNALGSLGDISDFYNDETIHLSSEGLRKAVFVDGYGGKIILTGSKFLYNDGMLVGGNVSTATFIADGHTLIKSTDLTSMSGFSLHLSIANGGVSSLMEEITSYDDTIIGTYLSDDLIGGDGNDRLLGKGGNDVLNGGFGIGYRLGTDIMTGGKGADVFMFAKGFGQDIVTDFDANGGGLHQDHIGVFVSDYSDIVIVDAGEDVDLDFGNGQHLTLKNVDHHEVTRQDFSIFG